MRRTSFQFTSFRAIDNYEGRRNRPRPAGGTRRICVVCERCTLARNPYSRMRGLLGRGGLAQGEGLLLQPAGSIHTFFMRFAIDAVFLDRERRVVRIASDVRPWRTAAAKRSRAVLEL